MPGHAKHRPSVLISLLPLQAKKALQLHDDKIAMSKTLAENDANIRAKKKAAKQQVCPTAQLLLTRSSFPPCCETCKCKAVAGSLNRPCKYGTAMMLPYA